MSVKIRRVLGNGVYVCGGVRVCVCACMCARVQIPADPRRSVTAPYVGVIVSCERPSMSARNRTLVLKSRHILLALNQLCSAIIC